MEASKETGGSFQGWPWVAPYTWKVPSKAGSSQGHAWEHPNLFGSIQRDYGSFQEFMKTSKC